MEDVRFNKDISAKMPQTILAYVADGFRSNGTNFQVLHLHTTNEHDRVSTAGTYYYDDFGEEVPLSAIKKFVAIDKVEQQMVDMEEFLRSLIK